MKEYLLACSRKKKGEEEVCGIQAKNLFLLLEIFGTIHAELNCALWFVLSSFKMFSSYSYFQLKHSCAPMDKAN